VDFRAFVRRSADDQHGEPYLGTEQGPADGGNFEPPACAYCGSVEFKPQQDDNGRIMRATCAACGGTMVSHGGQWMPDLIGSPHNHPDDGPDPASGGVGGIGNTHPAVPQKMREEDLSSRTAMPSRNHPQPPAGLHFTQTDEGEDPMGWQGHTLHAHLPGRDEPVGHIQFGTMERDRGPHSLTVQDMRTYKTTDQRQGIGSALQDELRRRHPDHMIDHGTRTNQGNRWWKQYDDPGNPKLDLDHPDNVHKWVHHTSAADWCRHRHAGRCMLPMQAPAGGVALYVPQDRGACPWTTPQTQQINCPVSEPGPMAGMTRAGGLADDHHVVPVKHAGYAGFVEPHEGHFDEHIKSETSDRDLFGDPENLAGSHGEDEHPIGHHPNLINFIREHHQNRDLWDNKAQIRPVDLTQPVYATQPHVTKGHLQRYLLNPRDQVAEVKQRGMGQVNEAYHGTHRPMFVQHEGRTYTIEGHHRTGAALLREDTSIEGSVYDADQHGFPEHPRANKGKAHEFPVTQPGLHHYALLVGVANCAFSHADPEEAFVHALYNHDDGICVATERRGRTAAAERQGLPGDAEFHFTPSYGPTKNHELEMHSGGQSIGKVDWFPNDGHVNAVETHHQYRRRGVGSALLSKAHELSEQHGLPYSNESAFYTPAGAGLLKNHEQRGLADTSHIPTHHHEGPGAEGGSIHEHMINDHGFAASADNIHGMDEDAVHSWHDKVRRFSPCGWKGASLSTTSVWAEPEWRFHVLAAWRDVRWKAVDIRRGGGVSIVSALAETITGHVQGDHGVYETQINYVPGSRKIGYWQCGCAWASYAWGRSPAYRRFEGRMCSHALALTYEAQSRGMFGREVQEDTTRPGWMRDKVRVRHDQETRDHDLRAAQRLLDPDGVYPTEHGLDLERSPIHAFAVEAFAARQDPADVMRVFLAAGVDHAQARDLALASVGARVVADVQVVGQLQDLEQLGAGLQFEAGEEKPAEPTHAGVALKAADTGRVLMIQRSHQDENDPAAGTWEFPGGGREKGDPTSLHSGIREFEEEVGHEFPTGGHVSHVWQSGNGVYQGHVVVVPHEKVVDLSQGRRTVNPDDPDGDDHEQSAWWHPDDARKNPALRPECKSSPWDKIKQASLARTADYAAADGLEDVGVDWRPKAPPKAPERGQDVNPGSTGFATGQDPTEWDSASQNPSTMSMTTWSTRHTADSWETGPHVMSHDDYDETAGALFPQGTNVHVKRYDTDHTGVGWAVVDHPGGEHGEAYIDPGKIMRHQQGGPDDGADAWARREPRHPQHQSPGQIQHLDHALGPVAQPNPEQHRHLTEAPGNDGHYPWGGHGKGDEHSNLHQPWHLPGTTHEHFDPGNPEHHADEWHGGRPNTPNGLPIRSLNTLHDEPEPALPSTDGAEDMVEDPGERYRAQMSPQIDGGDDLTPSDGRTAAVAAFQASGAFRALQGSERKTNVDIAEAARQHLAASGGIQRTAMATFTPQQQHELINEGMGQRARNFGDLKIEGTHYADIQAELDREGQLNADDLFD
jgi:8-oxo-dGTP pyrophosphatase MutT (NUDIX family)/GNAT superfamily N-acetyltransferase